MKNKDSNFNLKTNNAYLHHYKTNMNALITDHKQICVLLENAIAPK